jgi:hypothetical protein
MPHTQSEPAIEFLGTLDVARLAGCSSELVRQAATTGKLQVATRLADGTRLFRRADALAWATSRSERRSQR